MELQADTLHLDQRELDREHEALAALLERADQICPCPNWSCDCIKCPRDKVQQCGAEMLMFAEEMMVALLQHFDEEQALMDFLPKSGISIAHCSEHRAAHASFSTKYNKIIVTLDSNDVVESIGKLESFIVTWVREHILHFDAELASLLNERQGR